MKTVNSENINKLAIALLSSDTKSANIQNDVTQLVHAVAKNMTTEYIASGGDDEYFKTVHLTNHITELVNDVKERSKNKEQEKRTCDDTAKRVQRASEQIAKNIETHNEHSDGKNQLVNPFMDADGNLRRLTVTTGTKTAPAPTVKFMKAKAPTNLETMVKNLVAWCEKNDINQKMVEAHVTNEYKRINATPATK